MARMGPSKCPRCGSKIKIKAGKDGWMYDCTKCKWHSFDRAYFTDGKSIKERLYG